jgi:hypothetical protein
MTDYSQGFYLSRPMRADMLENSKNKANSAWTIAVWSQAIRSTKTGDAECRIEELKAKSHEPWLDGSLSVRLTWDTSVANHHTWARQEHV